MSAAVSLLRRFFPISFAQEHAEHRLDLVAECWHGRVVRTAACQAAALALRRCCLLALVASTHGAVRVLEQAVRAAVGTGALGVWRAAACGRASRYFSGKPGLSRVYPGFTWVLGRHPPVGRAVLAPARCTPLSVRGLARGTCRGVPPPPSCSHVLREWGRLGARGGVFEDDPHIHYNV